MSDFFLLVVAIGLATTPIGAAPEKPAEKKAPTVFTDTVKTGPLFDLLIFPARIIPTINATLLSDSDGIVKSIATTLGQSIDRKQKVMVIANTDPVYDYAPMTVTAPVRGVISSVDVTEGSRVQKGQKLATITDPLKLKISVEVPVSDIGAMSTGLTGMLQIASLEKDIPVRVKGISPFVDPATGTATAELQIDTKGKPHNLPPGMVGRVQFKAREHTGIQVPEYAIVYRGPDVFVRTVENGKAKLQMVTVGDTRRGQVEVTKGLKEGSVVILRTSAFVSDGETVTVQSVGEGRS